ncbi:MAG TPA: ectonucleotide pyrophosphatase/phosphodiesterase, partial [Lysobacter sp.]|nr:ectonucleotide pyrophosphatase/phosphodiesterase [Lysobacter sp.]
MSTLRTAATAAFLALTLVACSALPTTTSAPSAATVATPPVLLVSLDGFRPDYLELGITPNLNRLAAGGVRAEWMNPSYPTLTFPNHYTVVTGLRPDHHGIIHNTISDPELGEFSLGNRAAVADGRWWGGEPIWVGAENAGLKTATMFWPGSEAEIRGVRPTRWLPFDESLPVDARVDMMLGWLGEPAATQPRFETL